MQAARGFALVAAVALICLAFRSAHAQQPQDLVSIVVLDVGGKLLPVEQFTAQLRAGCPKDGSQPLRPHFRPRNGDVAIAIDSTAVPDPDPTGCGFGIVEAGTPESARLTTTEVPRGAVEAWTARTGILAIVVGTPTPVALPAARVDDRAVAPLTLWMRLAMILVVALAAGLVTGGVVYVRERRRSAQPYLHETGDTSAQVDGRHPGMLTLGEPMPPVSPAPPPVVEERNEQPREHPDRRTDASTDVE